MHPTEAQSYRPCAKTALGASSSRARGRALAAVVLPAGMVHAPAQMIHRTAPLATLADIRPQSEPKRMKHASCAMAAGIAQKAHLCATTALEGASAPVTVLALTNADRGNSAKRAPAIALTADREGTKMLSACTSVLFVMPESIRAPVRRVRV